jgi:hypothetical protein
MPFSRLGRFVGGSFAGLAAVVFRVNSELYERPCGGVVIFFVGVTDACFVGVVNPVVRVGVIAFGDVRHSDLG